MVQKENQKSEEEDHISFLIKHGLTLLILVIVIVALALLGVFNPANHPVSNVSQTFKHSSNYSSNHLNITKAVSLPYNAFSFSCQELQSLVNSNLTEFLAESSQPLVGR